MQIKGAVIFLLSALYSNSPPTQKMPVRIKQFALILAHLSYLLPQWFIGYRLVPERKCELSLMA